MPKIWLDLPAEDDIKPKVHFALNTCPELFEKLDELLRMIKAYHEVSKVEIDLFETRRVQLHSIQEFIHEHFPNVEIKKAFAKKGYAFVQSLENIASRKRDYLGKLIEYYKANDSYRNNPEKLFKAVLEKRHECADLKGLRAEYLMESVDPLHRNFLFTEFDNDKVTAGNSSQTVAFGEWYRSGMNVPFFAYLEGTKHCQVGSDNDQNVVYQGERESQLESAQIFVAWFSDSGIVTVDLSEAEVPTSKKFDCQDYPFQGSKGADTKSLAYVWTEEKLIFLGNHGQIFDAGKLQHSSLASGGRVRCAGMMSGKGGKVVYVDNNSGHFAPTSSHLRNFVRELSDQRAFDETCVVIGEVQSDHKVKKYSIEDFRKNTA